MKLFLIVLASAVISLQAQNKSVEIPSVFSDNMVLQQNSTAKFWGKADAGTKVNVKASWGKSASAVASKDGSWKTELKTPKAGGPYTVTLKIGDSTVTYNNVLTGEVWVCSGQSNMEMPLQGWPPADTIHGGAQEIKNANYSQIRLITVPKAYSATNEISFAGKWEECTPATVPNFSAAAYFFGKKLYNELKVPIGLIFTSWGGTPIEAWTSRNSLAELKEYEKDVKNLEMCVEEYKAYHKWLGKLPVIDVNGKPDEEKFANIDFGDKTCSDINYNDNDWPEANVPELWEDGVIGPFEGAVWFRRKIEIPASWVNKNLVLELGPVDDMDRTFINGQKVGGYEKLGFYNDKRIYKVPAAVNNQNVVSVAVRVINPQGGGGINGSSEQLKLTNSETGESIPLAGQWKYLIVAEYSGGKFYVFDPAKEVVKNRPHVGVILSAYTPSGLYNAMISPLVPYTIKGAIWYQGEANVSNPDLYTKQLPLLIKDWRTAWGIKDFPFYYVQIAPFNYGNDSFSERLREAQFKAMSLPHVGMAVTMDISNINNIHPGNKKDVGERLALWALAKDYGKKVVCSGPVYKSFKAEGNKIILTFDYAEGMVIKPIKGNNNFQVAGEDKVFKPAQVKVEGNKLIVTGEGITKAVAVRYAWSNTAEGTLFNGAGLPSGSFRTDNWEK